MSRLCGAPTFFRVILIGTLALASPVAPPVCAADRKLAKILPKEGWPVPPIVDSTKRRWYRETGNRCRVITTSCQQAAKDIAEFADLYLTEFREIFRGDFEITKKLTIRVFSYDQEFREHFQEVYKSRLSPRPALYSPSKEETWVLLDGNGTKRPLPLETTKHEFTHHMLHYYTGNERIPTWFNEGAACFFQYWNIDDKRSVNIRENVKRAQTGYYGYFPTVVVDEFGTEGFLTAKQLMKLSYQEFHSKERRLENLHYSESWALFHFLASSKGGRLYLDKFLRALRDKEDPGEVLEAKTMESLEKAWEKYIARKLIPAVRKELKRRAKKGAKADDSDYLPEDVLTQKITETQPPFRLSIEAPRTLRKAYRFVNIEKRKGNELDRLDEEIAGASKAGDSKKVEELLARRKSRDLSWSYTRAIVERLGDGYTQVTVRATKASSKRGIGDVGYAASMKSSKWKIFEMIQDLDSTLVEDKKSGRSSCVLEFVASYAGHRRMWYRAKTILLGAGTDEALVIECIQTSPAVQIAWEKGARATRDQKELKRDMDAIFETFELL